MQEHRSSVFVRGDYSNGGFIHRRTLPMAVADISFVYCWCSQTICGGIGCDSALPKPRKKQLLRPNSATPSSGLTTADISNSPSDSRTSLMRGEAPQRITIRSAVFSITSKWSVMMVPGSYDEELRSLLDQRCRAVAGPWYFLAKYAR